MKVQRYFQKELRLINPLYFAVWDDRKRPDGRGRWQIQKWNSVHPINHSVSRWRLRSKRIMTVKKESPHRQDDGYMPLDSRVLHSIREGLYGAINMKALFLKMDRADSTDEVTNERNRDLEAREEALTVWGHYREHFFDMGG